MLRVVCDLALVQDDQRIGPAPRRRPDGRPADAAARSSCQFQPADTPERLERFLARLHAYPAFMAANRGAAARGHRIGPHRAADRRPSGRSPSSSGCSRSPTEESVVADRASRSPPTPTATASRSSSATSSIPPIAAFLEALRGDYLPASRDEPGLWSAPDGEALYRTQILAWTTLELDPEEVHRIGLEELEAIETERRAIARAAGFGDDTAGVPRLARRRSGQRPGDPGRAHRPCPRGHRSGPGARPALLRRGCRGPAATSGAVEEYKEQRRPFAYYYPADGRRLARRDLLREHLRPASAGPTSKLASTTYHEAVPGHHFQIALEMENDALNVFRRLGSRMVGGAYVEGWGLYCGATGRRDGPVPQPRPSGSGCSMRRPGGPPGSSSTPASTPFAGRASGRSRRSSAPACPRPTRASRPIATSAGRVRP